MIILASQSQARRALLERAGIAFQIIAPQFDEDHAKQNFRSRDGRELAIHLASGKAVTVSRQHPQHMVVGADQTLSCDGMLLNKPGSLERAREQLWSLRGKTHVLSSAVSCATGGETTWSYAEDAHVTFRMFSEAALENYLLVAGSDIIWSVGAYHYEGAGIRLMEKVSGSDHAILGLPVLPLLSYLRQRSILPS